MRAVGSGSRAKVLVALVALRVFVAACGSHESGPAMATKAQCEELRAIEARLTIEGAAPAQRTERVAAELSRHQMSLATAGGEESLKRCMSERSAASIDCARRASSLTELARCSRQ